jgi:hypothetical protein
MRLVLSGGLYGQFWVDLRELPIDRQRLRRRVADSDRSAPSVVSLVLDAYRELRGRPRVGVKYPLHVARVALLRRWFPDCRIVHLTRDPRAILSSKLNDEATRRRRAAWGPLGFVVHYATLALFVIDYAWSARIHRRLEGRPGYRLLRYEELVSRPRETLAEVCRFAEIDFDEAMLSAVGQPSSHDARTRAGFDDSGVARWKTKLGRFDRRVITLVTARARRTIGRGPTAAGRDGTRCQPSY